MLTLRNLSYIHADKRLLFNNINLNVHPSGKIALIGNNGSGKTTLLRIIAGELAHTEGELKRETTPYYIPQILGQFDHLTVAEALRIDQKLNALHEILDGNLTEQNYKILDDDWTLEERCSAALSEWQLSGLDLSRQIGTLSGGEKTKIFLAGITIHRPELVLLDEPSNYLDTSGRECLLDFIQNTKSALIVVSHDRTLLNRLNMICELSGKGVSIYSGNYDFYKAQKQIMENALSHDIQHKEHALKKAKEKERETIERRQKLDRRVKKDTAKAGLPKIVSNTLRNSAERSTAKIGNTHAEKRENILQELRELRSLLPGNDRMKFDFAPSELHKGKILFKATNINFSYENGKFLWREPLSFQITSGERISVKGLNGSGKTTLINIILGNNTPQRGTAVVTEHKSVYIDQDYSLINNEMTILEQAQQYNTSSLQEHEVKIRLNRFLFTKDDWDKSCGKLSGGERLRLILCCLAMGRQSPDIIVLDEPTNNLDIQNIEILTNAINQYLGTLLVISHDEHFLEQINIDRIIEVMRNK